MHNLAIELASHGHMVSGSDDEIYEPAKSRLEEHHLLPAEGWDNERITNDIDLIILGMHAHLDNPELIKARSLGIKIVSFPEYIGNYTANERRIVICGSHGKSTITAMIMHVLQEKQVDADYLLGGLLKGFDKMVRISGAPLMIIEGDEYLSSRIDPTPKMMHYDGDIVVVTGIEWDHMNVFPTFDIYADQFRKLIDQCQRKEGVVYWYRNDEVLTNVISSATLLHHKGYDKLQYEEGGIRHDGDFYPLQIFGEHNMSNLNAAMLVCQDIGIENDKFLTAMHSFEGVGKRLQLIQDDPIVYLDYAHAPSKVNATVRAVKERHNSLPILAVYELHTYSSLNKDFLPNYKRTMEAADHAVIYYDEHALEMKRMPPLDSDRVIQSFSHRAIEVCTSREELSDKLEKLKEGYDVILMMSSGTFGGLDLSVFSN